MEQFSLYRKRFIPEEIVPLKNDKIIYADDEVIVTKWNTLRPKKEFSQGISCAFWKKGYKISKFMDDCGNLVYYYCDIIDVTYHEDKKEYIMTDLLADIKIYGDGKVEVVDLDEIADAMEQGLITQQMAMTALRRLNDLLQIIYQGNFETLIYNYMEKVE
ncbi:MAG: DUF402 domain-containing protein [Clostridiales bacterium]|nr:DUF402 domain-containing protein [Clostridiales bacterium]